MMDEGLSDLREIVRLPDALVVCSSTGWTDEKHMLYLSLLEESFVSQYDGEFNLKGLLCHSPRAWRHNRFSKGNDKNTEVEQGCLAVVEVDRAESITSQVEHVISPSCYENQEDTKAHCMDDHASTTEPIQEEASTHARSRSSRQSSACHFGKHRHSLSRIAEGSDQNFTDEETKGTGESIRGCTKKRLRPADDMIDDQVVPSAKAKLPQIHCHCIREDGDSRDSLFEVELRLLNEEPASSSCKDHGPKG